MVQFEISGCFLLYQVTNFDYLFAKIVDYIIAAFFSFFLHKQN